MLIGEHGFCLKRLVFGACLHRWSSWFGPNIDRRRPEVDIAILEEPFWLTLIGVLAASGLFKLASNFPPCLGTPLG